MGGSPSGMSGGSSADFGNYMGQLPDWFKGPMMGGPAPLNPAQAAQRNNPQQGGVGSMDWMKWHPDYKPTPGTAAWGSTHPDPAQGVKYGSAQWQQTHPDYQQPQVPPGLAQIGQPPNDLSEVIKHMFGGGQ